MAKQTIDFNDDNQVKEYLSALIAPKNPLRWEHYYQAVKHANELAVHFKGATPKEILERQRPNEPKEIRDYRLANYEPKTKSKAKRIWNVLARINNSKNYSIVFGNDISALIKNDNIDESLRNYTYNDYPYYGSLTQWVFDILLKQSLADPNAVVCFKPIELDKQNDEDEQADNSFISPFGIVYESRCVVDFVPDKYYTILLDEKSEVTVGRAKKLEGYIINVYTPNEIIEYRQIGNKSDYKFEATVLYQHNMGEVPVITLGGEHVEGTFPFLYESFCSGILPYWNEAIAMDSDLKANYVQHLYLERVEVQVECDNTNCGKNGADVGQVCNGDKCHTCQRCNGTGYITGRSPFGTTSVRKDNLSGTDIEFPGVTYIDKPTEIVTLVENKVKSLINDGFSAINMDILANVGENQSGVAKAIDRTDLDSFIMQVSNNIFDNLIYYSFEFINKMRYGSIQGIDLEAQMPTINKPTQFDILSQQQLIDDLGKNDKLPTKLKDSMLNDIIAKKFPNDEFLQQLNQAIIELDPLRGKTTDEVLVAVTSGWITKKAAILSSNVEAFIRAAYELDNNFFNYTYTEKMGILYKLVDESQIKTMPTFTATNAG